MIGENIFWEPIRCRVMESGGGVQIESDSDRGNPLFSSMCCKESEFGSSIFEHEAQGVDEAEINSHVSSNAQNLNEHEGDSIQATQGLESLFEELEDDSDLNILKSIILGVDGTEINRAESVVDDDHKSGEANPGSYYVADDYGTQIPEAQTYSDTVEARGAVDKNNDAKDVAVTDSLCLTQKIQDIDQSVTSSGGRDSSDLNESKKNYECDVCGDVFIHMNSFTSHMGIHAGKKPYKCSICLVSFPCKNSLDIHEVIHTNKKLYECDTCESTFLRQRTLIAHKRAHTGEQPFQCRFCDRRFSTLGNCKRHQKRIHAGAELFQCHFCNKKFTDELSRKKHEEIHPESEKPEKCKFCSKRFTIASYRKIHESVHTNNKPHKCAICGKGFARMDRLKHHGSTHDVIFKFNCDLCGKKLKYKNTLKRHRIICQKKMLPTLL